MRKEPPLPQELWNRIPADVQAAVLALVEKYEQTIARLERRVSDLEAQLGQNSSNSSRPPSSDPPSTVKRCPPRPPSGRKRGGQPGHPRHQRPLVPLDQVQTVVICKPPVCRRCGSALKGDDPAPRRHQVVDLPPIQPQVTEYQLHRLPCACCGGLTTEAAVPVGVPTGSFGAGLQSVLALASGVYRMSKRVVQSFAEDVLHIEISLGEVVALEQATATALDAPVAEAREFVQQQPATGVDETGWHESHKRAWLWAAVTSYVTVFCIRLTRGAKVAQEMLGECFKGVLTSDRWSAYNHVPLRLRQICWSHLRRDFQAMIDRGGKAAEIGRRLLGHSDVLFSWWHRVRDRTLKRSSFQGDVMRLLRPEFQKDLAAGTACACAKTAATCRELEKVETALWTFVRREGVEPTNNSSEQRLRHGVMWRKTSYGTDSSRGSHFVENILTVVASCRQQGRNVLNYLTACCEAATSATAPPSLLPEVNTCGGRAA